MDAKGLEAYISDFFKDQQARGVDILQGKSDSDIDNIAKDIIKEAKNG